MLTTPVLVRTVSVVLVLIGAGVLFGALLRSRVVSTDVPAVFLRKWRLLSGLIVLFICGYFSYLLLYINDIAYPVELLTGGLFFFGSIFVYGMIELSRLTISGLNSLNENLEKRVEERTERLKGANAALEASRRQSVEQREFLETAINALDHPFYVVEVATHQVLLYNRATESVPAGPVFLGSVIAGVLVVGLFSFAQSRMAKKG